MYTNTRIRAFIISRSKKEINIPYYYDEEEMMKGLKMRKRKGSDISNCTCIILLNHDVVFAALKEINNQAPIIHQMTNFTTNR